MPAPSLLRYSADHPYRPPHWRWERARVLRELGRRAPRRGKDDEWVGKALQLQLNLLTAAKDEAGRAAAYEAAGDVGLAYDLWDIPDEQRGYRHELEARLLAGESTDSICRILALRPKTLEIYMRLFFDIEDRYESPGWIVHSVIGSKISSGLTEKDFPVLLKAFAYFSQSPEVVTALVHTFDHPAQFIGKNAGRTVKDLVSFFSENLKVSIVRRAAMAARTLPLNPFAQPGLLLELANKAEEVKVAAGLAAPDKSQVNIVACFNALPWVAGVRPGEAVGAAEPRASELAALLPAPADKDTLEGFTFPEIIDKRER